MKISVVMPTLNEVSNIAQRALELEAQTGDYEWIVSDGGSSDGTLAAAFASGATIVDDARGRGPQLDAGARHGTGETLLFWHADTALPVGAFDAIRVALRSQKIVGGNFRLHFDDRGMLPRVFETIYAVRQHVFKSYFGDSAIFVRRKIYERIGGFGDVPIMEDYAFVHALERAGATVRLALPVVTSLRRFRKRPLATLWSWVAIVGLYHLGVSPGRLARMYPPNEAYRGDRST